MKASVKFKICVDLLMTAALYASMAYMLVGEEAHEWIGSGLALLFVLHNVLSQWLQYRSAAWLCRVTYTTYRS